MITFQSSCARDYVATFGGNRPLKGNNLKKKIGINRLSLFLISVVFKLTYLTLSSFQGCTSSGSTLFDNVQGRQNYSWPPLCMMHDPWEYSVHLRWFYYYSLSVSVSSHINCIVARCLINILSYVMCLYQVMMTLHPHPLPLKSRKSVLQMRFKSNYYQIKQ